MKKLLVGTATLSLLLAGCGQGEETKTEDTTKSSETKKQSNFVSEKEVKKELQNYVDDITIVMKEVSAFETLSFDGSISEQLEKMGNGLIDSSKDYSDYLKDVKEPIKYTKPSETMINEYTGIGETFVKMSDLFQSKIDGNISNDEFEKESAKLDEKLNSVNDDKLDEANKFLADVGIDTSEMDKLMDEDSSEEAEEVIENSEEETSSSDSSSEERQTKILNTVEPNKVINAGPVELTISKIEIGEAEVTEDNSYEFEDLNIGDKAQLIFVYMTLKNTVDQDTEYYADQAIITTDTGEQLEPAILMEDDGIIAEMKGDVESSGRVIYQLKNSTVKDLNSITFIAPSYEDPETYETITPEQKIEIPVK